MKIYVSQKGLPTKLHARQSPSAGLQLRPKYYVITSINPYRDRQSLDCLKATITSFDKCLG